MPKRDLDSILLTHWPDPHHREATGHMGRERTPKKQYQEKGSRKFFTRVEIFALLVFAYKARTDTWLSILKYSGFQLSPIFVCFVCLEWWTLTVHVNL